MAASSSSRAYASWRYDVFLSFRGEDTRKTFTSFLFAALNNNGFHTFHDTLLPRGQEIAPQLLKAIEQSQLSIVVFSKNYADSRWCLDELVKINDCRRSGSGYKVLPVFLDVEPSDVRKQKGCYKQAFLLHCIGGKFNRGIINRWRVALRETGELSGPHLQNDANRDEEMFVRQIVKEVAFILKRPHLHVANHPVGIEPRVEEVCSRLDANAAEQNGVGIVVIRGIGGIGKTAIAKATFNFLASGFESYSFLADVRSTCGQVDHLVKLQKQLISDLRNEKNTQDVAIHNHHQGTQQLAMIIRSRRVLLVVDDVDKSEQLEMLAIKRGNLLSGSRVIVTSRYSSLTVTRGKVSDYEPRELNKEDSIQLFKWYVEGNEDPNEERYETFLEQVNKLAGGLPLVLEVWGTYFRTFKIEDWHDVLSELRKVPHGDVQAKLRISYDSLDDRQKRLFLDIACFFIGMKKEFVIRVLDDEASRWSPKLEIEMLLNRCLIRLDNRGGELVIMMHDVIRDMGREIVRQENPHDPEKRSRLCDRDVVIHILKDHSGTEALESIFLDNSLSDSDDVYVNAKALEKWRNLRLLYFKNVQTSGTYNGEISFMKLKCLRWHGFPLKCLPINLNMSNLVALKLKYSRLKQLWEGTKEMNKLRFLDVSYSLKLIKTPNFSGMRSLEVLKLHHCTNLIEVDESVSCLDKLVLLDLSKCEKLTTFPFHSIFQLKSLEKFNFSGCYNYVMSPSFPLPSAMRLGPRLIELDISNCDLFHVPPEIGSLELLQKLNLSRNLFSSLPDVLRNLQRLDIISLNECPFLQSIPDLPSNISAIFASGCISLMNLPQRISDLHSLRFLQLLYCFELKSIPDLPGRMKNFEAHGCRSLEKIPLAPLATEWVDIALSDCPILEQDECDNALRRFLIDSYQAAGAIPRFESELSGTEVPSWFNHPGTGGIIRFKARCEVRGWIFCVIGPRHQHRNCWVTVSGDVFGKSCQARDSNHAFSSIMNSGTLGEGHNVRMWVRGEPLPNEYAQVNRGDDVQIRFTLRCKCDEDLELEKCGMCLIYEDEEIDDQTFTKWTHEVIDSLPPHDEYSRTTVSYDDDSTTNDMDDVSSPVNDSGGNHSTRLMAYLGVLLSSLCCCCPSRMCRNSFSTREESSLA